MSEDMAINSITPHVSMERQHVASYDSSYEYTLEHLLEVQALAEEYPEQLTNEAVA